MKAEELRIGNWVNLYDEFYSEVTGLTNTSKVWCVNNPTDEGCAWSVDEIKPIPITEEWLVKFGFTKTLDSYFLKGFRVRFYEGVSIDYKEIHLFEIINYPIHQLQNLYHSLTGEELTIKEKVNG